MTKKTEPNSFFLSFVGEYVQVITNVRFNGSPSSGRSSEDATIPLVIEGYVLDADDQYTYLSPDLEDEIKQAIKNDVIVYIQITNPVDEDSELLQALPNNIRKRDMN